MDTSSTSPGGSTRAAGAAGTPPRVGILMGSRSDWETLEPATSSLAITFPLNVALGIPIYYRISQWIHGS